MATRPTRKRGSSSARRVKPPSERLTKAWRDLLRLVPGYDPFRDEAGFDFDIDLAQEKIDFFAECLHHTKAVRGRPPFRLEPWQQAIVANLYGWVSIEDGFRRYRECFLEVGRKNGKSPLAAGLILCTLSTDDEPGAEIYGAAKDEDQASLVWQYAKGMVLEEPELRERFKVYETAQSIVWEESGSFYKVISGEPDGKHGYNAHMIVLDELHVQPNRKLVDTLITSMSARKQPLILYLTTSDFDRPSICNEKYDYACGVRDGTIPDPAFLPVIYEVPRAMLDANESCWKEEKVWYCANPNLGISKSLAYMHRECLRAQHEPSYLNTFLRLELNIKTQQDIRWVNPLQWAACSAGFDAALGADTLRGRPCWAGLDLASTSDLCALALYFPQDEHRVLSYAWVPDAQVKARAEKGFQHYATWHRQGWLRVTPGNVADYDVMLRDLKALSETYHIQHVAMDRWNSQNLENQLQGEGLSVIRFGQGFQSMSAPCKELERLYMAGQLQHGANPVLTWAVGNVQAVEDAAGNIKFDKSKSSEKIDPAVALVMAIGAYLLKPEMEEASVYSTHGMLVL